MTADPLLAHADALYALGQAAFTPARDALAKELRGTDRELAARVKGLRKPSAAAWVVNLLVRRDAAQVEQVLEVGVALRDAQAALDGQELRSLTRQRRQLTAAVTSRARGLAADEGVRVTEAVGEQVEGTLTAAMVDPVAAAAVRSGLLVAALSATGVDAVDVAGAVAVPEALGFAASPREATPVPPPTLRVVPAREVDEEDRTAAVAAARREAQGRLKQAQARVARSEQARRVADTAVRRLQARTLQVQAEIDELRRRIADQEARAEALAEDLAEAEDAREEAASEADAAAAEREERRADLEAL